MTFCILRVVLIEVLLKKCIREAKSLDENQKIVSKFISNRKMQLKKDLADSQLDYKARLIDFLQLKLLSVFNISYGQQGHFQIF